MYFFFYASSYQLFEMIISLKCWQKSAGTKHACSDTQSSPRGLGSYVFFWKYLHRIRRWITRPTGTPSRRWRHQRSPFFPCYWKVRSLFCHHAATQVVYKSSEVFSWCDVSKHQIPAAESYPFLCSRYHVHSWRKQDISRQPGQFWKASKFTVRSSPTRCSPAVWIWIINEACPSSFCSTWSQTRCGSCGSVRKITWVRLHSHCVWHYDEW